MLTQNMQEFSRSMTSVRVSVEWSFGEIERSFTCIDLKSNLKIGLSCVEKMYLICAVIKNALSCIYGNQTSESFYLSTTPLEEYFS